MKELEFGSSSRSGAGSGDAPELSADDILRCELADDLYRRARLIRQHDYPSLHELSERSLALSSEVGNDGEQYRHGMAAALSLLAYHSAMAGLSEAALSQASQALALLGSLEPSIILGDIYDAMGWARLFRGDFAEAIAVLTEAQRIAEVMGDRGAQAYALDTMASVYAVSGHPHDALDGHLRALAIQQELGDGLSVALVRNNVAYAYLELKEFDAALASAEASLAYISENGYEHIEMAVHDTLATVLLARNELEAALAHAQRGLELARSRGSHRDETDSLITLGRIVMRQGRYADALGLMEQALTLAERHGRSVEEWRCHEFLATIHEELGDPVAALAEHRRYHELERACINGESETRLSNMQVEFLLEAARKDAEIHRLRSLALEQEVGESRVTQVRLEAQASLDPLTGLYNRRHISVLAEELQAAVARNEPACLAMFDIDHFKEVNDVYGHFAGDRVLISLARQLRRNSRATDVPLRYGGDEFVVLLIGMDGAAGAETAERLRATVARSTVRSDGLDIGITISVGVACVPRGGIDLSTLIARADRALYTAKETGRDRVVSL